MPNAVKNCLLGKLHKTTLHEHICVRILHLCYDICFQTVSEPTHSYLIIFLGFFWIFIQWVISEIILSFEVKISLVCGGGYKNSCIRSKLKGGGGWLDLSEIRGRKGLCMVIVMSNFAKNVRCLWKTFIVTHCILNISNMWLMKWFLSQ